MTGLIIFVYLADVIPRFGDVLIGFGLTCLILVGAYAFFAITEESFDPVREHSKTLTIAISLGFILVALGATMPKEKTLYIMAGIYAGKTVIDSPSGQKAIEALNLGLDKVIESAKSPPKEKTN